MGRSHHPLRPAYRPGDQIPFAHPIAWLTLHGLLDFLRCDPQGAGDVQQQVRGGEIGLGNHLRGAHLLAFSNQDTARRRQEALAADRG
jgi:hypothetical protein